MCNRRMVSAEILRRLCGVCVSLPLVLPLERFFTRSLYFDLYRAEQSERFLRLTQGASERPDLVSEVVALSGGPGAPSPFKNRGTLRTRSGHQKNKFSGQFHLICQSLQYLIWWRSLNRGEGLGPPTFTSVHDDSQRCLRCQIWEHPGLRHHPVSPSLWAACGFWTAHNL